MAHNLFTIIMIFIDVLYIVKLNGLFVCIT